MESFTTAQGEMSNKEAPAVDLSSQPSPAVSGKEVMEFRDRFSSRAELQSLVGTELRNLDSFPIKEDMLQRVKENLAEVIDMGFNARSTGVKHALPCFIQKTITETTHHGLMDEVIYKKFWRTGTHSFQYSQIIFG